MDKNPENQSIIIRFHLGKEDLEGSLKLMWRRKRPPWILYAAGVFLMVVAYTTVADHGYPVATAMLCMSLIAFALPSLLPYIQSKRTLEILEKSPESELEFTRDGVKKPGDSESFLPWSALRLEENARILNLLNQKRQILAIIPKRAFRSSEDLDTIHQWGITR